MLEPSYGLRPTILVVEDEAIVRMYGADIIEQAGYRVIEAANADEAIAILEKAGRVQLLFSDVDMPGSMDGLQLAETVHSRWPKIRLLLTSGHHDLALDDVPDHGHFIPKPYSSDVLVHEVESLLGDAEPENESHIDR